MRPKKKDREIVGVNEYGDNAVEMAASSTEAYVKTKAICVMLLTTLLRRYVGCAMTRRASHPQYTMGIIRSRIMDKGPGVQVG